MSIKTTNAAATAIAAARHATRPNDEHCPHCGVSLQGAPIPPESQHNYHGTHYSRALVQQGQRDSEPQEYVCPDCGGRWPREGAI